MSFKFEYKIIDNFFDKNDLDLILGSITEENKKRVNDNEIKIFPNRIFKNNVETSLFKEVTSNPITAFISNLGRLQFSVENA